MFNREYNISPSYLVYPIFAPDLTPFLFSCQKAFTIIFSCKSLVRSKFDIMVLLHNFCKLVIMSLLFSFYLGYAWHACISVHPSLNLLHEIFPLFCVLFVLYSSVDAGYIFLIFWWLFYVTYFTKVCKWTLFVQQNMFLSCTALTANTWLSTHLTSSAYEMRIILCDSPMNT